LAIVNSATIDMSMQVWVSLWQADFIFFGYIFYFRTLHVVFHMAIWPVFIFASCHVFLTWNSSISAYIFVCHPLVEASGGQCVSLMWTFRFWLCGYTK
jgi:hypothetical protein